MITTLLLTLAVSSSGFSFPKPEILPETEKNTNYHYDAIVDALTSLAYAHSEIAQIPASPLNAINAMLQKESATLNIAVINKVMTSLQCVLEKNIEHTNILTVIDYSLPSSEKRLWVFDLNEKKLLYNTYVSHGIKSGTLVSKFFSNKNDSKATSIGVYKTEKTYYGRDGLSLRLTGLDNGFNDNASNRYIVMHGGWYVSEQFIKKYGRAGRSWGCPAVPENLKEGIINTIKDSSLFVAYYPNDNWFSKSKFLNCHKLSPVPGAALLTQDAKFIPVENEAREKILFSDLKLNNKREETDPILVMSADKYAQVFHSRPPVERMLRRQINNMEYIALSNNEFKNIIAANNLNDIDFVVPVIKMVRGYYETQMQIVNYGKILDAKITPNSQDESFTVRTEKKQTINLKPTDRFIRWVGL